MFARNIVRCSNFRVVKRGFKSNVDKKIEELGLKLPTYSTPKGNYINITKTSPSHNGTITMFLAGHLPQPAEGPLVTGKVGKEVSVEDAYKAAQLVGLNIISTIKNNVENMDKVRILKLVGFVNCVDSFSSQPAVVNGCSDLMVKVFGENGRHARSAVGTNALPLNVPVEIEAIIEVEK